MKRLRRPGNPTLVAARDARGWYTQAEFADAFEKTAAKLGKSIGLSARQIRRWESATPSIPTGEYRHVLEAMFECPLAALGFPTLDHATNADTDRADEVGDLLSGIPHRLRRLMRLEETALALFSFETLRFPGVLQSPRYALATIHMHDPGQTTEAGAELLRLRLARAESFVERCVPARFIVSQAALYHPIGGLGVLAEQLGHVLTMASRWPMMRFQVLPLDSPYTVSSPMMVMETEDPGRYAAWNEQITSSHLVDSADDTAEYMTTFARLNNHALSPARSLDLVDRRRRDVCTALETTAYLGGASPRGADGTTA